MALLPIALATIGIGALILGRKQSSSFRSMPVPAPAPAPAPTPAPAPAPGPVAPSDLQPKGPGNQPLVHFEPNIDVGPAPAPAPSATATVTASVLNVRSGPGEQNPVIGQLAKGERVTPVYSYPATAAAPKGWTYMASNAFEGFVSSEYLAFGAAIEPPRERPVFDLDSF